MASTIIGLRGGDGRARGAAPPYIDFFLLLQMGILGKKQVIFRQRHLIFVQETSAPPPPQKKDPHETGWSPPVFNSAWQERCPPPHPPPPYCVIMSLNCLLWERHERVGSEANFGIIGGQLTRLLFVTCCCFCCCIPKIAWELQNFLLFFQYNYVHILFTHSFIELDPCFKVRTNVPMHIVLWTLWSVC